MRVVKTPPPPLPVPSGSKTTTTTTVPKAPSGTIIPQLTTQTTIPQPLVGQPPVTTPPAGKTTVTTLPQKKGAVPLPIPSPVPVQENVPATGRAGMGIPSVKTPAGYTTSPDLYEARLKLGQATIESLREGVPKEEVEAIVSGEEKKTPGGWRGALANIINFDIIPGKKFEYKPVESLVIKPLTTIDVGRRALVSGFRESVELAKDITEGKQVYKPTDYIPVHKQTGLPIAKVGDPVISNWERIINTPIPNIEKINTYEEAQKAQDKIVEETATTTSGSFKDLVRQTRDVTTGFGDIPYIQTGNKWIDRTIGFFGDVVLDPTTYLAGPGALAKEPLEAAAAAGVKRTAVELAQQAIKDTSAELATRVAAREAAEVAAKEATDYVDRLVGAAAESAVKTPIIANRIPESAAIIREAEQRAALAAEQAAAAQAAEAAAKAAADAAKATAATAGAGVKAAEKAVTQAQRQAPRRVYGAGAREAMANTVRGIREQALDTATNVSIPMVERVAAQKAATVLSDDLIADIAAKGYSVIKGEAARLLGVKPGLRIGIPTFAKYTIPGTGPFTSIIGKGVAGRRLWFVNTPKGAAILNKFMGAPEGGIIGEADILTLRTGLSQGTIKGAEAVDAVALLAADKAYRGQLNLLRKEGVAIINGLRKEIPNFPKIARKLAPYFETPEASWGTRGLKALNADERAVYDSFQQIFNDTFAQADRRAKSLGGAGLTKLDTYFPHVQSAAALQWAARNRKLADKTAEALGIDTLTLLSGNYLDRMLVPGKTWFGYTLQPADIAGGVTRLNEIARQYGKLKFDFFATDAGEVLAKYLDNHSRFMSYTGAIQNLPRLIGRTSRGVPTVFDTKYIPSDVIKELTAKIARDEAVDTTALAARLARNAADLPLIADALKSVESRIVNLMRPDKLVNWSPEKIQQVRNLIDAIGQRLTRDTVVKREVAALVEELDNQIIETTRLIDAGVIDPAVGGMLLDEAEHMATSLVDDIGRVRTQFVGTPKERWAGARELAKLGFESINAGTMPNIYAQREVASMLSNLKQLDDTKFAKYADMLLSDLTIMSKGYLTGSLGFHVRNALGGIFTLAAAGGRMDYLYEAVKIQRKLESNLKQGISYAETIKTLSPAERQIVSVASGLSGATGFGQFGEIAQAAGAGRTGITGRTATGLTPFAGRRVPFGGGRVIPGAQIPIAGRVSAATYKPLRYLREKGSALEQTMRFALLYDGIKQGLSPLEAANRVNKYLIDYGSPTKLDRQMRSVYTFWTWMSRNLPLQVENMWMAPSAYQKYLSFRRNMQDKDGESPFLPEYLKETGAFKIPFGESIYARPDLGFPGASAPNLLQQAASGDVYEVLSGLTPALRVALENEINKQLFSGAPLRSEFKSDKENAQAFRTYLYSQLLSPAGLIGRYLSAIPGDEPKWLQTLTGSKLDRELNTTLSLLGAPGFKLRSIEERNEILRRYYLLQEKKNRAIQNNQPPEE